MTGESMFRSEYRAELESWLRRRFRFLCLVYLGVTALDTLGIVVFPLGAPTRSVAIQVTGGVAGLGIIAWFGFAADLAHAGRRRVLDTASRMIIGLGAMSLLSVLAAGIAEAGTPLRLLVPLFFWHFSACLFLPWTPRESMRPFLPLMLVWAVIVLVTANVPFLTRLVQVVLGGGILVPGLALTSWRLRLHQRAFKRRMVGRHFLTMRRELSQARTIHESIFPDPIVDGAARFEYMYTPARELGGDFVHARVAPDGTLHIVVLDVTGHGLAAALTVNRLYGEIERIRAEDPDIGPGAVLTLINRYIALTMIDHHIFATGAALALEPREGALRWANAGHPPAFLRAGGHIERLDSTAPMLGALDEDEFVDGEISMPIEANATVLLYTDGVIESRDRSGSLFGLERLRDLFSVQPAPGNWPAFVASSVARHSGGRTDDDILVCTVTYAGASAVDETANADTDIEAPAGAA